MATNQGVVGSNPASRATYAERRGLPETEALFLCRSVCAAKLVCAVLPRTRVMPCGRACRLLVSKNHHWNHH
ncbi:hypothetical protein CBM2615_A120126 [Cupriavidus taiwanensis]|uniref:Uncharacterized protein n=1 Tax=Cupriavidus taiwanensis TaxID=164546 RepID=A0A375DWJ8_9BURK|nr:hypothetical protein CBM2615_A120126 [Cupriavidus taiwanensis]SOZ49325.1 hypothetical protein CBM2614_A120124 [Cupriavidus taiwanensis]SOZ51934.1 hypothetical protein CBM2613_A110125 [Cupriavidus taiwanensis]SPA07134.1 hypothetical protein CBM2625_A90123 [Cupriavidus taiwanensis]